MAKFTADRKFANCFVCSPANPIGLHLVNTPVNGKSHMELIPHENLAGLNGIMHGGFTMMLLDEIMYYAMEAYGVDSVTLHSETDFKKPAVIGKKLIAEGWVAERDGKKFKVEGEIRTEDGEIIATGKGLYYEMDMSVFLPEEVE